MVHMHFHEQIMMTVEKHGAYISKGVRISKGVLILRAQIPTESGYQRNLDIKEVRIPTESGYQQFGYLRSPDTKASPLRSYQA